MTDMLKRYQAAEKLLPWNVSHAVLNAAHDEKNQAKVGDKVRLVATRPLSKTKRYELAEVIEKAIIL